MSNQFSWIPFYMEFADKLREYHHNRPLLLDRLRTTYALMNSSMPKLEEGEITDIDPFTVFALFNNGSTDTNRTALINAMAKVFDVHASIPSDYDGVPVRSVNKAYYGFGNDRGIADIDNLWELFDAALDFADDKAPVQIVKFEKCFNIAIKQKQTGLSSLTMALFWIRPYVFLAFDQNNQSFLRDRNHVPEKIVDEIEKRLIKRKNYNPTPDASDYLAVCETCLMHFKHDPFEYKDFPSISYAARQRSQIKEAYEITQQSKPTVNTWLLTWNPKVMDWEAQNDEYGYQGVLQAVRSGGTRLFCWRCISSKVCAGDRVFMIKLGAEPKGIIATGFAISDSYDEDGTKLIDVFLTDFRDYHTEEIISYEFLKSKYPKQNWTPQASGTSIKPDAARWLIENWESFQTNNPEISHSEQPARVTYLTEIIAALHQLGGKASLAEIYAAIEERDLLPSIHSNDNWKNNVNAEIQKHCSATMSYVEGNEDLFYPVNGLGKGIWGLTGYAEMPQCTDPYTKVDFLHDVFMTESEYDKLAALVHTKKNVILQGAPGVGKTFSAKRLAYSLMGETDDSRIKFVQFHQSYSYEDFIMGYRPNEDGGFDLQEGVFYQFCQTAQDDPERDYFFIIDEINRGNLSKIFGELLMPIEADKRGEKHRINLVYGNTPFWIPANLHIIGMMNTADRSLAMIDYALRRRFCFYTMQPAFENADGNGFGDYTEQILCETYKAVVEKIKELNTAIRKDKSLGKGFEIGHSYFSPENPSLIDDAWVRNVVEYEIIPLIEEYWFDNETEQIKWKKELCTIVGIDYDE